MESTEQPKTAPADIVRRLLDYRDEDGVASSAARDGAAEINRLRDLCGTAAFAIKNRQQADAMMSVEGLIARLEQAGCGEAPFAANGYLPAIDGGEKTLPLINASRNCWEGRIGEKETLPMAEQMTSGFSERQLKHAIALLLNEISRYGHKCAHATEHHQTPEAPFVLEEWAASLIFPETSGMKLAGASGQVSEHALRDGVKPLIGGASLKRHAECTKVGLASSGHRQHQMAQDLLRDVQGFQAVVIKHDASPVTFVVEGVDTAIEIAKAMLSQLHSTEKPSDL